MKRNQFKPGNKAIKFLAALPLAFSMMIGGCSKDSTNVGPPVTTKATKVVSGTIMGNVTWSKDTVYQLQGIVRVGSDDGATISATGILTIEAGTTIEGIAATSPSEIPGTLVVQRGSKIIAEGSSSAPIVFTSSKSKGVRRPGDWGGVVLCGKAPNNIPGGVAQLEGGYGAWHGGSDAADNSGTMRYVRIEFAGYAIQPNQEINGLTMGSVGSGTIISYVQVSYGADDSYEWFGGTVNCDHLIAYRGQDDDFDTDNGFSGNVQFGIGIRDNNIADQSGSNGFESDNDASGSSNTPYTSGSFSNMTIIGPKEFTTTYLNTNFNAIAHLRRNTKLKIYNSFLTGYPNGILIDGQAGSAFTNATNGELVVKNTVVAGVQNWGGNGFGSKGALFPNAVSGKDSTNNDWAVAPRGVPFAKLPSVDPFDMNAWFFTALYNNAFLAKWQDAGISQTIFELGTPTLTPSVGSVLLNGADFTGLPAFFQTVSYIGAFGSTDWTTSWSEWDPINKAYN